MTVSLLAGCAPAVVTDDSGTPPAPPANGTAQNNEGSAIKTMDLTAKDLEAPTYGEPDATALTVASGANDFAFRLSAALSKTTGDRNLICSPYSVWLPLAALVNATDDANKAKLLEALGAQGVSEADINSAASRMLYDLTNQRDKDFAKQYNDSSYTPYDPLQIANAIFVDNNVTLKQSFAQTFLDYYRGTAMNVDFSSSDAVDAVNQWASDNTDGLITDIVQSFDPQTIAAIANAIYFSDRWQWEFDPGSTVEDVFHAPSGDSSAHFMLREGDDQTYYEDDQIQAMPLTFTSGDGMYIILPKDGDATGLLSSMTNDYLNKIQNGSVSATGKLLLPRFTIESDVMDLKGTLTALGVPLFDEASAPLTGGVVEENINVWLSSALHKAMIQVDEKGTTAAAVTVMAMAGSGMVEPQPTAPFEMNCNKPFVFVLYGNTYDGGSQVLFTGIVNQP